MRVLLVPSPLVGPASWEPVARAMGDRDVDVRVVDTGRPEGPQQVVDAVLATASDMHRPVLVAHSNAGLYAPTLAERLDPAATVYVDAALAGDGPDTGLSPPRMLPMLRELADGRLLPPWTQWWGDLGDLFPDARSQQELERRQPRLPLSYFESRLPTPMGWMERPSAYLAFGDTYADELAFARAHGWPVSEMAGGHLHALHDPEGVADEVLRLARRLVGGRL